MIPSTPGSVDLAKNIIQVHTNIKTYRTSLTKTINWNLKVGKGATKLPDAAFKKLSRAAQFFREGHYSLEDIKKIQEEGKKAADAVKKTKEIADAAKKATDLTEKIQSTLFKNIPGSAVIDKAARVGGILGILSAIGFVLLTKLQEFVTGQIFENLDHFNEELTKANTIATNNGLKLKTFDSKLQKFQRELDANAKDFYQLNKQTESVAKNAVEAKKQSNEALYEAREGRKITSGLAEAARKLANDALYEARQNKASIEAKITDQRLSFDAKIQSINAQIAKFNSNASDAFQKSVNATISKLQADLATTKAQVNAIRPQAPINTSEVNANAVAAARAIVAPIQSQIGVLAGLVAAVQSQIPVLSGTISNLANSVNNANSTANQALNEAKNKGTPNLTPLQQQLDDKFNKLTAENSKALGVIGLAKSDLLKEFEARANNFERQSNLTADQRFEEFRRDGERQLGIIGLTKSDLLKQFDARAIEFERQSNLTADQRFEEFQRVGRESLGLLKKDLQLTTKEVENNKITITKIDTKLGEQAKVNELALPKLDQILGILPLIPARAADAIKPSIPTIPEITTATGTAMCNNLKTGCGKKSIDDAIGNITGNANSNAANILGAVNAVGQGADLALLGVINKKLGDQLPGGIGGKLTRFAQWAHLDRALNLMNFAANIHNGAMLSNNLGQTLLIVIGNLLSIVGLKDAEGQAFDIGSVISKGIEELIKGAIGEENYKTLDANWKKANRIYQSAANLLNSIQSLSASILNALEVVGQWNAKGFNALKRFGVVGEKAYSWMNPNIDFSNKYFTALENATNIISQVDQVASEVLSIKDTIGQIVEQKKEVDESLKETDGSKQKAELPEAAKLAQKEKESKAASAALPVTEADKESDEDN